ncbi:uncharacterized protein LOC143597178 [Bidens hawaiensis]|uniref:uncharacterized protein LOC143597178 n=1 Tax=Bidens hawaiensis TaxID=980011 RepID=UPI004049DB11
MQPDPSSDLAIPQVNASCNPVKGMVFESVDHAYDFYCEYAKKAGFCVRKGGSYMNDGLLKSKCFTCSKEGHKPANSYDSMAEKDSSNRPKLTHVQQDIIYEMSTLNLGLVKAFNILRTKYEGFEEVGATKDDCKNFKQSLTCYIGGYDAEMVVQRLSGKKNCCDDRLFWAYEISKKNYLAFGDIISFDAIFKTNKYLSLVEVFSHFDHCMEIQRQNGRKNDHDTRYTHPDPVSENPFEKEAELMYTKATFNDFQDDMYHIRSGVACLKSTEEEDFVRFSVFNFNAYVRGCLEVLFKKECEDGIDSTISCGCKRFEHYGLLCRHSLYILNLFRVTRFPKRYMVDRWKRDAGVNPRTAPISSLGNDKYLKVKEISKEITLAGEYLINSYVTDVDEVIKVRDQMNIMIKQADETRYKRTHLSKRDRFAAILGYDQSLEVTVRVPSGIKTRVAGHINGLNPRKR